ncbi:MAG: hypothetical protein ACLGHN_05590 [Bacteriovoracia bacterium]
MKYSLITAILLFTVNLNAQTEIPEDAKIGAPPNARSGGADASGGISDSPQGTTKRQAEEYRERAGSMGGAPNVGGGMGTGTGAGSTVGPDIEEGTITAGSTSGEENE